MFGFITTLSRPAGPTPWNDCVRRSFSSYDMRRRIPLSYIGEQFSPTVLFFFSLSALMTLRFL